MLNNFQQIREKAKGLKEIKIVVAAAQDPYVLKAVYQAHNEGMAEAILVGRKKEIIEILKDQNIDETLFEIIDVEGNLQEQAAKAVEQIINNEGQALMKGQIDTSILLKEVLKEKRMRTGQLMSAIGVVEIKTYPKLLCITDSGMNIAPDLEGKKEILANAVYIAKSLGIAEPKVAVICAKEKVDSKMQDTLDAEKLVEMNREGEIKDCLVGGPFGLDNAISKEAARSKGIDDPVAGEADILLVPDLVSGNILYKALTFLGGAKGASIITGAKVPIILTSRAEGEEVKINSIALAVLMAADR